MPAADIARLSRFSCWHCGSYICYSRLLLFVSVGPFEVATCLKMHALESRVNRLGQRQIKDSELVTTKFAAPTPSRLIRYMFGRIVSRDYMAMMPTLSSHPST